MLAFIFAIIVVLLIHEDNRNILEAKMFGGRQASAQPQQSSMPQGMMEKIQKLKTRIEANAHDVEALVQLGNSYFDIGRHEEAIGYYQHALEHNSENTNVLIDLGVAHFNLNQNEQAVMYIEKALEIDPKHKQGLFNLGVIHSNLNNFDEAKKYWNSLIKFYPDSREAQNANNYIEQIKNQK